MMMSDANKSSTSYLLKCCVICSVSLATLPKLFMSILRRNQLTLLVCFIIIFVYVTLLTQHQTENVQKLSRCYFNSDNNSTTEFNNLTVVPPPSSSVRLLNNNATNVVMNISRPFFNYLVKQLRNSPFPGARNYTEYKSLIINGQQQQQPSLLTHVKPLRNDFGPVVNDVTSFRYPIDIPPCRPTNNSVDDDQIKLFLVIISAPNYFDKREAIRQTWLTQLIQSTSNNKVKLVGHGFIVGLTNNNNVSKVQKRLQEESAKHGDILQVDMLDTYADLSRKVAAALNWINNKCSSPTVMMDFVLKVDDDVYVNTRNLMTTIDNLNNSSSQQQLTVYGTSADGIVRREGKFKVNPDMWPWSNYPPYSMGAFLLMSGRSIEPLLAAAQTTPYFPFEDTYLGLCADKAAVKMRFSPR